MARVVVDSREARGCKGVVEALREAGLDVEVRLLPAGDYLIEVEDGYVVEHKRVTEFVSAVKSGRLWEQLEGLKRCVGMRPVLVLEGSLSLVEKFTEWSPTQVSGIINGVVFGWGIPVVVLPSRRWLVAYLVQLAKSAELEGKRPHPLRMKEKIESLGDEQLFLVEGLPGVSAARARMLLKVFGTPRRIFTASMEELMNVKGIGRGTAEKIIKVLTTRFEEK